MTNLIQYKNTPVHYQVQGKGSAIVLLHGFLENLNMWDAVTIELSKRNKVIGIDLLGHGKSGNLGYVHTMEEQAQLVKTVLNHLQLRRYVLVGHSMGGYVALAFAKLFPQTIKGLCLMNSTALADSIVKKRNRDRAIKAVKQNFKTFIRIAIPNLFSEENRTVFEAEVKQVIKEALQTSPQSIVAALEGMKIRKDQTKLLKGNVYPKLIILGEKDPVLDADSLRKQLKKTSVKLVSFPDGHMSHIENKEALVVALQYFIKSCK